MADNWRRLTSKLYQHCVCLIVFSGLYWQGPMYAATAVMACARETTLYGLHFKNQAFKNYLFLDFISVKKAL